VKALEHCHLLEPRPRCVSSPEFKNDWKFCVSNALADPPLSFKARSRHINIHDKIVTIQRSSRMVMEKNRFTKKKHSTVSIIGVDSWHLGDSKGPRHATRTGCHQDPIPPSIDRCHSTGRNHTKRLDRAPTETQVNLCETKVL
jgi:hypothetical protein